MHDNGELREALEAILARIDSRYDDPALVKKGPLSDTITDVYGFAIVALAKKWLVKKGE